MPLILIFCCQLYICGTSFDITDTFRLLARFKILKHKAKASPFRRQIDSLLPGKYARAVKIDLAIIWRFQPSDHPQKRRLAAARGTEQRREAAAVNRERCRPYDLLFLKALRNSMQTYFHTVPLFCTWASIPEPCKVGMQRNVK